MVKNKLPDINLENTGPTKMIHILKHTAKDLNKHYTGKPHFWKPSYQSNILTYFT